MSRLFQWLAGDRRGEILVFDNIIEEEGMHFITFKDGSRINSELVAEINEKKIDGKFMAEIDSYNNAWGFKEVNTGDDKPRVVQDWESQVKYEVPTADEIAYADLTGDQGTTKPIPKKKKIELIPPRPTKNKFGRIANSDDMSADYNVSIDNKPKVEQPTPEKSTVNSSDPVYIMMEKSKKVDTEVNMTLTISLPSSHLFDVVRDSFEEGDKKALEYIIENIDITDIKNALKEGIKSMYEPNEDSDDNKLKEFHSENELDRYKEYANFAPEMVEEPVVRDALEEEIEKNELAKELHAKAEKINQENE
jgi:hypothetical protein